jgi:hypothetical protein
MVVRDRFQSRDSVVTLASTPPIACDAPRLDKSRTDPPPVSQLCNSPKPGPDTARLSRGRGVSADSGITNPAPSP